MSGRCKCCNRKLFDTEISNKISVIGDEDSDDFLDLDIYDDFCNICKFEYRIEYDYNSDHEYVQGTLESGLKSPDFYKE